MRIERAIDAFLDWRVLEQDATKRSTESYRRILDKLAGEYPEADVGELTTGDLRSFLASWVAESKAERGVDLSAATRSNIILVLHSFFGWAEAEDLIGFDPSRKIKRPRKRKPDVYRPSLDELAKLRAAAVGHERPPLLLMEGVGLRRSEVLGCRWEDIDFDRGRIRVKRKGQHWEWLPIDPDVLRELRISYREVDAELAHYMFRVEVEQWTSGTQRARRLKDGTRPGSEQALWRLVQRVCKRAGIRLLSPISCDMGSRTASFARAAVISSLCRRLWVTLGPTRHRATPTTWIWKSSLRRSLELPKRGPHKRRRTRQRETTEGPKALEVRSGGGGNRTRVSFPRDRRACRHQRRDRMLAPQGRAQSSNPVGGIATLVLTSPDQGRTELSRRRSRLLGSDPRQDSSGRSPGTKPTSRADIVGLGHGTSV